MIDYWLLFTMNIMVYTLAFHTFLQVQLLYWMWFAWNQWNQRTSWTRISWTWTSQTSWTSLFTPALFTHSCRCKFSYLMWFLWNQYFIQFNLIFFNTRMYFCEIFQKRVKDEAAEGGFQESGDILKQRHGRVILHWNISWKYLLIQWDTARSPKTHFLKICRETNWRRFVFKWFLYFMLNNLYLQLVLEQ